MNDLYLFTNNNTHLLKDGQHWTAVGSMPVVERLMFRQQYIKFMNNTTPNGRLLAQYA